MTRRQEKKAAFAAKQVANAPTTPVAVEQNNNFLIAGVVAILAIIICGFVYFARDSNETKKIINEHRYELSELKKKQVVVDTTAQKNINISPIVKERPASALITKVWKDVDTTKRCLLLIDSLVVGIQSSKGVRVLLPQYAPSDRVPYIKEEGSYNIFYIEDIATKKWTFVSASAKKINEFDVSNEWFPTTEAKSLLLGDSGNSNGLLSKRLPDDWTKSFNWSLLK